MTNIPAHAQPSAAGKDGRPTTAKAAATQPGPIVVGGKLGLMVDLMRRPEGADLGDMMEATGWQEHSIRGAIAGELKKRRGLDIISEKPATVRIYRIPAPAAPVRQEIRQTAKSTATAKPATTPAMKPKTPPAAVRTTNKSLARAAIPAPKAPPASGKPKAQPKAASPAARGRQAGRR